MTLILFAIIIFLGLIQWVVFIDVVLSWGTLIGIQYRPIWIQKIVIPLYEKVKHYIPTTYGTMDFTPIIIFICIEIITSIILKIDPSILSVLSRQ